MTIATLYVLYGIQEMVKWGH